MGVLSLVKSLTEKFAEETFKEVLRQKFKNFEEEEIRLIPEWEQELFKELKKLGKAKLEDKTVGIYTIKTEEITERTSKKKQFEFAKKVLLNFYDDAGLFVFYDNAGRFRLSLIFKQYTEEGIKFSPWKRFTFFVSPEKLNRTFIKRLLEIEWKTFRDLVETFAVEPLSQEFYKEIKAWFYWARDKVKFPTQDNEIHLVRLLSRLIFVWFLKEKGFIPKEIFEPEKLKSIVKDFGKSTNYYNAILQNLFFATLNQEIEKRKFAQEGSFLENRKHYGVKNLYRYKELLLVSEEKFLELFSKVPFVNGGLFECLDNVEGNLYVDGFSRDPRKRAIIPDKVFFNEGEPRGLINILRSYDWTADESTPLDVEVALDPELLGKVFENLLAEIDPETEEDERKRTGSYYTPKEVVNYMVEESLLYYLKEKTEIEEEKLKRLIYEENSEGISEKEKEKIINALAQIKVIDPACGSGAFLVGMLQKLTRLIDALDPENELWKEVQKEILREKFEKAYESEDYKERLKELEEDFDLTKNYPDYARKLYILQNSLYGVDIQPIAIELTKLRFFITLLIDQKTDENSPNFGIKPLPNLDLNFICADFLVKLEAQRSLNNDKIVKLEEEIRDLSRRYFRASTWTQKKSIREKLKAKRKELSEELKKLGFSKDDAQKIADFDPINPLKVNYWFDPEWMFELKGFDIVISNPPYIRQERLKRIKRNGKTYKSIIQAQGYKTFVGTADIYVAFYERGLEICNKGGILTFISSNKFMRASYGEKLRNFLLRRNKILEIIDFGGFKVFGATVDVAIVVVKKEDTKGKDYEFYGLLVPSDLPRSELLEFLRKKKFKINSAYFKDSVWITESEEVLKLREKIKNLGKPLKDWKGIRIYFGIKTGYNEAFIVDTKTKEEILKNCKTEEERKRTEKLFKKVLRGRDIERYCYNWAGLWLIYIPWHFPIHDKNIKGASKKAEEEFKRLYPSLYNYLLKFKNKLMSRNKQETGIRYEWYALQRFASDYYQEFEKPKIVWKRIGSIIRFAYDEDGVYVIDSCVIMTHKNNDKDTLKYILAILNSPIAKWFFEEEASKTGTGDLKIDNQSMEKLLIPPNTDPQIKNRIIEKVDEILKIVSEKGCNSEEAKKEVEKISREIDELVYKLYNLTPEETKIIEQKLN